MAPPPLRHHSVIRGCTSKGAASLAKIIAIISTVPPSLDHLRPTTTSEPKTNQALGVDLNLRLGPPQEIDGATAAEEKGVVAVPSLAESGSEMVAAVVEDHISNSPAESAAQGVSTAGKSSEGECDPGEIPTDSQKEVSGITNDLPWRPKHEEKDDIDEEVEEVIEDRARVREGIMRGGDKGDGNLALLLEAVRQVSGGLLDEDKPGEDDKGAPLGRASSAVGLMGKKREGAAQPRRRRTRWEASAWCLYEEALEESAPLVRSKRGRSQALPSRFRDSVLEPWA